MILAELAVLIGIGISYYAGATTGGVVLVAVIIYVAAVVVGKLRTSMWSETTAEIDNIDGEQEISLD